MRVDSDIIDHIIQKEDIKEVELTEEQKESLTETVKAQMPVIEKTEFGVDFKSLGENSNLFKLLKTSSHAA